MTNFVDFVPIASSTIEEERIRRLEDQMRIIEGKLANNYLLGRLRFDRTVPANSADVQTPDALYDVVYSPTFIYILINSSGTLTWVRYAVAAF